MTIEEQGKIIRFILTCLLMAEYGLINLGDNVDPELKKRIKNAIAYCRNVQGFFVNNKNVSAETKEMFKQQFMGSEIVFLTELVELCFGMDDLGISEIIRAVKEAIERESQELINTETKN
jgi:hypothetical protein